MFLFFILLVFVCGLVSKDMDKGQKIEMCFSVRLKLYGAMGIFFLASIILYYYSELCLSSWRWILRKKTRTL